jgi:galactose mutarotase-like enzyme
MTWLGQAALALETPSLRLITVPGMGAKIVSLFDKRANREWLLPPINRRFEPAAYGASFVDQDMSGWDEMFPTINACAYPVEGSYHGSLLPDHGEVWALSWQADESADDRVCLSTEGHALPYRLTRTVQALSDSKLRLAFQAINTGLEPFMALWAAHPQFIVNEDTRIVLPSSVHSVVNVLPTEQWGEAGLEYDWPTAQARTGQQTALDRVGSAELRKCRKFYLAPDSSVSWAGLQQGEAGDWLRLSWDVSTVPYLGVWVDEGTYNAAPTVALEPSTGFYDSLSLAWENNRLMQLLPNAPYQWHLDIEMGTGALVTSGE